MTNQPTGPAADEVPEADWSEQQAAADVENGPTDPLTEASAKGGQLPEAAEADILEQLAEVPLDEDI